MIRCPLLLSKKSPLLLPFLFLLLWLLPTQAMADGDEFSALKRYAENIYEFNVRYPQEKVYLHMDNRSYCVGDTIWFKAYVMNATTLHPTQMSGVLYVELLNEKGVEMERKKMRLENGMCHGDFVLKVDYRTGYYEIRAYTRYMLNWGNEPKSWTIQDESSSRYLYGEEVLDQDVVADMNHCMFSRVFPVYMKPTSLGEYTEEMEWYPPHTALASPKVMEEEFVDDSLRISFYPEGGSLVENLPCVVAFEVTDQWGGKREISGWITEGRGKEIARFSTAGRGRGMFRLTPQSNKRYFAHVEYKGRHYRYKLPSIQKQGAMLHVHPPVGDGEASFHMSVSEAYSQRLLAWTLQCRGELTYVDTLTLCSDTSYCITIDKESLKPGVNQLTLYTSQGEILADRLFFVSPKQFTQLHVYNIPDSVRPHEEVALDMHLKSSNGWFTQGHFSIAITDADWRGEASHDTRDIRSELLLASDLKGFIENVDSYFKHTDDSVMAADIDRLMLVQGWRRYEWKSMLAGEGFIPRFTPERGLEIDGYVVSDIVMQEHFARADKYKRIPNVRVKIDVQTNGMRHKDECVTDSLGRFHFDINQSIQGNASLLIRLYEEGNPTKFQQMVRRILPSPLTFSVPVLDRAFSPSTTPYSYYQNHSPEELMLMRYEEQSLASNELLLEEVTVKKRKKVRHEINFENPDMVISYYKEWNNLIDRGIPLANYYGEHLLWNFNANIDPSNPSNEMTLHYSLGRVKLWGRMERHDSLSGKSSGFFERYYMPKYIKVYSNLLTRDALPLERDGQTDLYDYAYLEVESYSPKESPRRAPYMLHNGTRLTYYNGYSQVREFYSPDYSECTLPDTADYRRTLHWAPDVWTDHLGRASVSFYNNSQTTKLHIRAEGFTRTGEFIVYDSDISGIEN